MKRSIAVLAALGSLVGEASALAAPEALPLTTMSPAHGARIPRVDHITFRLISPLTYLSPVWVEVSTRKTVGQDGTLADRYQVDFINLFSSYAHPRRYSGPSDGDWTDSPGKYYWQVYAAGDDPETNMHHYYRGPIRSLRVVKRCHYVKRHGHRRRVCK